MDGLKCEFHSELPEGRDVTNEQCARALSMTHAFRFLAVGCIAHQGKLCHMFNLLGEVTPIFSDVGTAIGHEPDESQSVPVVPAPA